MSEQITQQLGFDASKAITELGRLRGEFHNLKQSLQSMSGGLRKFPAAATPAIQALRQLATDATLARNALGTLGINIPVAPLQTAAQGAGQAVSTLATQAQAAGAALQTSLPAGAQAAAASLRDLTTSFRTAATGAAAPATRMQAAVGQVAAGAAKTAKTSKDMATEWTASWTTMARVVQTQIIVRTMGTIIRSMQEARQEALQLSLSISEAMTIGRGQIGTFQQLAGEIREMSREMGVAPLEVTAGLYQTLSNQVVEASDAMQFNASAAKLSIATQTELTTVVNALSSVINSYGLDVAETDRVSNVLFKTIEHGRLRLEEFGDTIGRASPLTAALGIHYDELLAAIAAITQKGVPAHTAITQLTQITQKLLRPTDSLLALYREWGVTTGAEAIQRFGGLAGVLDKMKDATAGNDREFGDLLGTVRAVVGGLNLAENGAESFRSILADMRGDTEAANRALITMEDSAGRRATRAVNDLKVSMLGVGDALLQGTTPALEALGSLLRQTDLMGAAFVGLSAAAVLLAGKLLVVKAAAIATAGVLAAVFAIPAAVGIASAYATLKIRDYFDSAGFALDDFVEKAKRQENEVTEMYAQAATNRLLHLRTTTDERSRINTEYYNQLATLYQQDYAEFTRSSRGIRVVASDTIKAAEESRKKLIQSIQDAVTGADAAIMSSTDMIRRSQQEVAEVTFEATLKGLDSIQQAQAHLNRAFGTAAQLRQAYAEAGADEEKTRAAREVAQLALSRTREARSHAERAGNHQAARRALQLELDIQQQIQDGERQFIGERSKLKSASHREALHQLQEEGERGKALHEEILRLADREDRPGVLKSPEQQRADLQLAEHLFNQYLENAKRQAKQAELFKDIVDPQEFIRLSEETGVALSRAVVDWSRARNDLAETLQSRPYMATVRLILDDADLRAQVERVLGPIDITTSPQAVITRLEAETREMGAAVSQTGIEMGRSFEQAEANAQTIAKILGGDAYLPTVEKFVETLQQANSILASPAWNAQETMKLEAVRIEAEKLRTELLKAANTVQQAALEGRALTDAEAAGVEKAIAYRDAKVAAGAVDADRVAATGKVVDYLKQSVALLKQAGELNITREEDMPRLQQTETLLDQIQSKVQLGVQATRDQTEARESSHKGTQVLVETEEEFRRRIEGAKPALEDQSQLIRETGEQFKGVNEAVEAGALAVTALREEVAAVKTTTDNVTGAQKNVTVETGRTSGGVTTLASNLQRTVGIAQQLTAAMAAAAAAAKQAAAAIADAQAKGRAGVTAATGGRYFATGGRGTDKIPAMLSRGEFVINAKSARQFFPQLQAMNAGQKPIYREQGGSVTNVGDVNVSVQGGDTAQKTIREIASGLRRELRRGTIRLD